MVISSLLVTVNDEERRDEIAEALGRDPRLQVGSPQGARLPLVAEASDERAAEAMFDELRARDGVLFVDLVAVYFSEESHGTT